VPHLLLARELLHSAVRDVAAARGTVVGANWMGKTKAFLQTALVLWGLSFPAQCSAAGQSRLAFAIAAWAVVATAWAFFAVFAIRNRAVLRGNPA
jgi:phosphatidylglycerophosphate synthase